MSETVCTKTQEEYEDDFEKDLDWLISEEERSGDQVGLTLHLLHLVFLIFLSFLACSIYLNAALLAAG